MNIITSTSQGAGDAFIGALAYYISRLNSLTLKEKIERSAKIASHTVTRPGTQTSYDINIIPPELLSR